MASERWSFDPSARRYRDGQSGRFVSQATVVRLRDDFAASQARWGEGFAARLADGSLSTAAFEREMQTRLRKTYLAEYQLGRGGINAMTAADYGRVGQTLKTQYRHLRAFAEDIGAGRLTEGQIRARANLYQQASRQAFERGRVAAWGMPDLPAYPGDGSTECRANCKCHWSLSETRAEWRATWTLGSAEHCETCVQRAADWRPYRLPKPSKEDEP